MHQPLFFLLFHKLSVFIYFLRLSVRECGMAGKEVFHHQTFGQSTERNDSQILSLDDALIFCNPWIYELFQNSIVSCCLKLPSKFLYFSLSSKTQDTKKSPLFSFSGLNDIGNLCLNKNACMLKGSFLSNCVLTIPETASPLALPTCQSEIMLKDWRIIWDRIEWRYRVENRCSPLSP